MGALDRLYSICKELEDEGHITIVPSYIWDRDINIVYEDLDLLVVPYGSGSIDCIIGCARDTRDGHYIQPDGLNCMWAQYVDAKCLLNNLRKFKSLIMRR